MPRPDSMFKRIINQLVLDVKKVTQANGFVTDFHAEAVHILPNKWKSLNIFPHAYVTYRGGSRTEFSNSGGSKKTKIVRLVFFFKDSKVKPSLLAIADIETDLEYLWYEQNPRLREDATNDALVTKIKLVSDNAQKIEGTVYEVYTVDLQVVYHEWWNR